MSALRPQPGGDVIRVRGIRARGRHGVLPEERERGQTFSADVALVLDAAPAAADDDLRLTVDYSGVAREAYDVLAGEPVDLIETLAHRLAERLLALPGVVAVEVEIHKPDAPVGVPVDDVSVHVVRQRAGTTPQPESP